jgi:cell division control protein 45
VSVPTIVPQRVHVSNQPVCSEFGLAFLDAKERCNARTRHGSFDTSVIEINKDDLQVFLETLCETGDR